VRRAAHIFAAAGCTDLSTPLPPLANSSSTGGVLTPSLPYPLDDDALDALLEGVVAQITTLPNTLVFPRWQPTPPKQPAANVNWCAFGIMLSTPDEGPAIGYDPVNDCGTYQRHEQLDVLASFYGPNAKQYAALLRDGLAIPQNCEQLTANDIAFNGCGPIRPAPELVNQQWIKRQDMGITLHREVNRTYAIHYLAIAVVDLRDDTVVNRCFRVPDVGDVLVTESGVVLLNQKQNILATEPS